jgi:hypothetical protein
MLNKAILTVSLNTNVNNNKIPYFIYDETRAIIDGYFLEESFKPSQILHEQEIMVNV